MPSLKCLHPLWTRRAAARRLLQARYKLNELRLQLKLDPIIDVDNGGYVCDVDAGAYVCVMLSMVSV